MRARGGGDNLGYAKEGILPYAEEGIFLYAKGDILPYAKKDISIVLVYPSPCAHKGNNMHYKHNKHYVPGITAITTQESVTKV